MIKETIDPHSGAVIIKKDPDSLKYEKILEKLAHLELEIKLLKERVKELEVENM